MTRYDDTNHGALFKHDKKEKSHPDYCGPLNVDGAEYRLLGWIKESKKGEKYMSLVVKPDNTNTDRKRSRSKELDDESF
jgi:hypothetical protein